MSSIELGCCFAVIPQFHTSTRCFFHFQSTCLTFSGHFMTFIRTSHIEVLIYISFIVPSNLTAPTGSPPGVLVWGCEVHDGSVGGWIALPAISWLFICRCVCVLYNLWVSTMASNAFLLHRWDNGNARVSSVPQVDCNWISMMSGANLRSGKLAAKLSTVCMTILRSQCAALSNWRS